jgi:hypothetical protein
MLTIAKLPTRSTVAKKEQFEDVWSRAKTVSGYSVDEVRSVLQKSSGPAS